MIKYYKWIPYVIIVGLVIALSVTQCSKQRVTLDNHESELKAAIQLEKRRVIDLANREQALRQKLKDDSLKSSVSALAFKREIKVLKYKLSIARIPVSKLIDSIPQLDRFVDLQDSTILVMDGRIDSLEVQKLKQWRSFNSLISIADEKAKVSTELVEHYDQLNKDLSKQVRRERNKKTFWKITAGVLAGGIVAQSLGVF